jgi:hypothetical protein
MGPRSGSCGIKSRLSKHSSCKNIQMLMNISTAKRKTTSELVSTKCAHAGQWTLHA